MRIDSSIVDCSIADCPQPKASTKGKEPTTTVPQDKSDTPLKILYSQVDMDDDRRMMTQPVSGEECKYWTRDEALTEAKKMAS